MFNIKKKFMRYSEQIHKNVSDENMKSARKLDPIMIPLEKSSLDLKAVKLRPTMKQS